MTTFDLLNKKVQQAIFDMKWENFRPIQDEAIEHLIKTPSDLIISAPTASGKTEAAFLPIISQIADRGKDSVKILYISPLKALINDQFVRISRLCEKIDFPITKWHGDANSTKKVNLIKNPAGILLITPESIEALLLNKQEAIGKMFKNLEYIVIDEIHSFIGNERGSHLKSLIRRIEYNLKITPVKIGLSATINNTEDIRKWLNPKSPESVKIIKDNDNSKSTKGLIKTFCIENNNSDENDDYTELEKELFKIIKKDKNLIFANAKMILEKYCDTMQHIVKDEGFPDNFLIHHGSLSKEIREYAEKSLKNKDNISVFCTNTLELGIDIGNIDKIIFLSPPFSVSSMIQRLGRSGRKENATKEFRFLLETKKLDDKSTFIDRFRMPLIQSIAIVELMLQNWSEPLDVVHFDYSTFVHQILSFLGQTGGANANEIYKNISEISFYGYFSKEDFIKILNELNNKEIIYQYSEGIITLSKKGERIVENYNFYAAFDTPSDWKVIYNGKEIGQISSMNLLFLNVGSHMLLAGKRWEVLELKEKSQTIIVKKAYGKKPVRFNGGEQDIHRKIHQKMLEIYESKFIPKYLSQSSIPILEEAYEQYEIYAKPKDSNILIALEGTKIQRTIQLILKYKGVEVENAGIGFSNSEGKSLLISKLKEINFDILNWNDVLNLIEENIKLKKKFDNLLPLEILNKSFLNLALDVEGAKQFITKL